MLTRKRLAIILAAVLTAGAVLALTLSSASAGPSGIANQVFLTVVFVPVTATPTSMPTIAPPTAEPTSTSTATDAGPTQQPPQCDQTYPTICIPYPPPDLNCSDIPYTNFAVVPPDDHHFDQDHDGIGCETGQMQIINMSQKAA
jgi:hypothetical protein